MEIQIMNKMIEPTTTMKSSTEFSPVDYLINPYPRSSSRFKNKCKTICICCLGGGILIGSCALFFILGGELASCNNTTIFDTTPI